MGLGSTVGFRIQVVGREKDLILSKAAALHFDALDI